jgi:WD40 repeat protein
MRLFDQLKRPITSLVFSPDGSRLAATSRDGTAVAMWDLRAHSFRRWHPHVDGPACSLAYSPDGKMLAVGGTVGLVLPYVIADNSYDTECDAGDHFGRQDPVYALAFAPGTTNPPVLATASRDVRLWDFEGNSSWGETLGAGSSANFVCLAWSHDDLRLAAGDADTDCVTVWKLNDRFGLMTLWWIQLADSCTSVAFAPTGHTLALAASRDGVALYDVHSEPQRLAAWEARPDVLQVAFHPEGKLLATGGSDGTVAFWDVATQRRLACYDWKIGRVSALVFHPDGMTCAAGGHTGRVVLWDVDQL